MEAAKEEGNLLCTIRPPKLEDAGLEDCALPHESIKEAFFKAANSVRSWTRNDDVESETEEDDDCVKDLNFPPKNGESYDSLIGVTPASDPPGPCGNEKGLSSEVIGDEVGVHGEEDDEKEFDKLIGLDVPEGRKRDCVDALQGLKIHEKKDDEDEEKKDDEKPILIEDII